VSISVVTEDVEVSIVVAYEGDIVNNSIVFNVVVVNVDVCDDIELLSNVVTVTVDN
jgi:hypothetical protein